MRFALAWTTRSTNDVMNDGRLLSGNDSWNDASKALFGCTRETINLKSVEGQCESLCWMWIAVSISVLVEGAWSRPYTVWARCLLLYARFLLRRFRNNFQMIRKFANGSRQICRSSTVFQHFVHTPFCVGGERLDDVVVFHDALWLIPTDNFDSRVWCVVCQMADSACLSVIVS